MPRVSATKPAPQPVTINVQPNIPPERNSEAAPPEKEPLSPTWFWELIADIPKDEWGKIYDMLLFRIDPKVPMHPGYKGYLDTFAEPISPAWVKARYGGGRFRLVLQKNGRFKTSHEFEIEGQPIYDLTRERVNGQNPAAAGTGGEAFAKQVIDMLREELTRSRESGPASTAITDETIGLVTKAAEKAMDMIKNQVPAATDPSTQLSSMVSTLKNLGLVGQPSGGGIVETISVLKTLGLIGQPAPDPMAQINTFLTIFEKLDALRGERAAGPRDWKATLAEKAIEHVPEILREVRATAEASRDAAGQRLEAARANERIASAIRGMPAPPPVPSPAAVTPPTPAASALKTVPAAEQENPAAETSGSLEQSPAFEAWIKQRMVAMIAAGEEPEAIVDFLDIAKPGFANDLVAYPPEQVTLFLSADPILKEAVAHPRWEKVLAAARAYILESAPEMPAPAAN